MPRAIRGIWDAPLRPFDGKMRENVTFQAHIQENLFKNSGKSGAQPIGAPHVCAGQKEKAGGGSSKLNFWRRDPFSSYSPPSSSTATIPLLLRWNRSLSHQLTQTNWHLRTGHFGQIRFSLLRLILIRWMQRPIIIILESIRPSM